MKILCVSDKVEEMVYSTRAKDRFNDVDLVISCGDLPYYYLEFITDALRKPVYYVRGNHANKVEYTSSGPKTEPMGCINLHRHTVNLSGLLMAGFEGSVRYKPGPFMYTQRQMWTYVFQMVPRLLLNRVRYGRYLDILVTHAPPFEVQDRNDLPHQGFQAFRWFLKVFQPALHFHGHIHLYANNDPWMTTFERTRVINAYGFREVVVETWVNYL
jgi:Icc-related predicted phosphoesterase